jgi:hypothetical protein
VKTHGPFFILLAQLDDPFSDPSNFFAKLHGNDILLQIIVSHKIPLSGFEIAGFPQLQFKKML